MKKESGEEESASLHELLICVSSVSRLQAIRCKDKTSHPVRPHPCPARCLARLGLFVRELPSLPKQKCEESVSAVAALRPAVEDPPINNIYHFEHAFNFLGKIYWRRPSKSMVDTTTRLCAGSFVDQSVESPVWDNLQVLEKKDPSI